MRSWVFSARLISPVRVKRTRPWAKAGGCGRAASQMASRRAVTSSTGRPRASASAMPSAISCSYWDSSRYGWSPGGWSAGPAGAWRAAVPRWRWRRLVSATGSSRSRWLRCSVLSRQPPGRAARRRVHRHGHGGCRRAAGRRLLVASGPVRPSSAAQLWMSGQSRWPWCRSCSAAMSARIIAVMAVLRSRVWPGSQDTSQPFRPGVSGRCGRCGRWSCWCR